MRKITSVMVGTLLPAFLLSGFMLSSAVAQDKAAGPAPVTKVLLENDKVKVYETIYKPGDVNTTIPAGSIRIVRTLKGGTLLRTYADGTTKPVVLKTGAVQYIEAGPAYTTKNTGKTVIQTYVVQLK